MEFLALSSKVRWTDIIKIILGFLPPYPLLNAKKNEEAKSQKTKHNHLAFNHKALKIVLKDLLYLEKNKDGLQVDTPGLGFVNLHVRLAFIVGDIKRQNLLIPQVRQARKYPNPPLGDNSSPWGDNAVCT
jgi:hypothetical protein